MSQNETAPRRNAALLAYEAMCGMSAAEREDALRFREAARAFTIKHTASAEAANACLVALGIHLPDGTLAPEYQS